MAMSSTRQRIGMAIGTIFAISIFIGLVLVPLGMCKDDTMEEWMQDHTLNVQSTTTYKYEQGCLRIKEVYTGEELKERFGIDNLTKEYKLPGRYVTALEIGEGSTEKVEITEKVTVLTTLDDPPRGGIQSL